MPPSRMLAKAFARNLKIIEAQTDGLSHQDSLVQVPGTDCLNWVLGHPAEYRDQVLAMLGEAPALGEESVRYRRESDPVTGDGPGVISLDRLLAALQEGQERISAGLAALPDEALGEEQAVGDWRLTLEECLQFAYFPDTCHTGRTELLRAAAGKTDKVL